MTTGRPGVAAAPNAAYAGQVVQFPDPVRAERHPAGVRVDEYGHPDFGPYAAAAPRSPTRRRASASTNCG